MRRRAASVQEARHREHQRSGLDAADRDAAACNAAERGEKPRLRVGRDVESGDDDERAAHVVRVERRFDRDRQAAGGRDGLSVGAEQPPAIERAAGDAVGGAERLDRRSERQKRHLRQHQEVDVEGLRGR